MTTTTSRSGRWPFALAGVAASAWAFFLLPPQLQTWSTDAGMPPWLRELASLPVYDGLRDAADAVGLTDHYALFGAAVAPSFVLLAIALRPATRTLGILGALLHWVTLLTALIVVISYVTHALPAPWNGLWGAEALGLALMGLLALACGVVAVLRRASPVWPSVMLTLLLPVTVASTVLFGYWPHGSLVLMGIWLAIIALGWPDTVPRRR
ncbi:MAG: hypothetical protein ABWX59_10745 [Microbacteriaceae bacterium]